MNPAPQKPDSILTRYLSGDLRALSRLLTLMEDGHPQTHQIMEAVFPHTGQGYRIGLTGAPGAGKSTCVNHLARLIMEAGHNLGVLAIDPSSPFSGGAVLGDRIRFDPPPPVSGQKPPFFRSAATRGHQGGLAKASEEMSVLLEGFGYDRLLIESVGVGQVGLDIAAACDTTVVLLVPESGDDIQALKAGLLEIADVLVVNKADRPGSKTLATELREAVHMRTRNRDAGWQPPVLLSNGINGEGLQEVLQAVNDHRQHRLDSVGTTGLHRERMRQVTLNLLREALLEQLDASLKAGSLPDGRALDPLLAQLVSGKTNPFALVQETVRSLFSNARAKSENSAP